MGSALLVAVGVRGFLVEPRLIPSPSMEPTLEVGDRLLVEKLSYRFHPPRPGDIVVFERPSRPEHPGPAHVAIKRVIAVPGQEVRVRAGQVLIDGQPLYEPYLARPPSYAWGPAVVPEDMLFVMGDNRDGSADSHVWGFLPRGNVIGRAWLRFWPPARADGF